VRAQSSGALGWRSQLPSRLSTASFVNEEGQPDGAKGRKSPPKAYGFYKVTASKLHSRICFVWGPLRNAHVRLVRLPYGEVPRKAQPSMTSIRGLFKLSERHTSISLTRRNNNPSRQNPLFRREAPSESSDPDARGPPPSSFAFSAYSSSPSRMGGCITRTILHNFKI
jgi:hypothetical protein